MSGNGFLDYRHACTETEKAVAEIEQVLSLEEASLTGILQTRA